MQPLQPLLNPSWRPYTASASLPGYINYGAFSTVLRVQIFARYRAPAPKSSFDLRRRAVGAMQRSPSPEFDPSNARQGHMAQIQPPLNNPPSPAEAQAFLSPPVDERPQSMMSDEDIGAPSNSEQKLSSPSTYLHRSYFAFFLVFLYSVFAVFAWSLIGILSVRPIGARSYGMSIFPDENDGYNHSKLSDFLHRYSNSENYYRAAKVINAGLGVLTLPLATAICVRAAVTYTQQRRHGFTIRQAMALADQGWISPDIWLKLIHPRKGLRRYGSTLLWLAMLLHILG